MTVKRIVADLRDRHYKIWFDVSLSNHLVDAPLSAVPLCARVTRVSDLNTLLSVRILLAAGGDFSRTVST